MRKCYIPVVNSKVLLLLCFLMSVAVVKAQFPAPYCTETFPNDTEPISKFVFGSLISNTTSAAINGTPALENFTSTVANVIPGATYNVQVQGNTGGAFTTYVRVFIDFNKDGDFVDAGESFDIGTIATSTGVDGITATANVTIPLTAAPGATRMRVSKKFNSYPTPCNTAGYGQAEDYTINIQALTPCTGTPEAGTGASSLSTVCLNQQFTLSATGFSIGGNLSYQWQSSTDQVTWTPITGATNTFYSALTTTQSASTFYRLYLTCLASNSSDSTNVISVTSPALLGNPSGTVATYTIDKTLPASATNFVSFNAAYNAMKCGIISPVVFNVANGPYTEQLIVNGAIPGASAVNTITFNGNGNTLTFTTTSAERAIIKLKNTKHFTFENLVIANTGTANAYGVQLFNNADSNTIRNCVINLNVTATANSIAGIVVSGSETDAIGTTNNTLCDYNTFVDNTINGGYYGITQAGTLTGSSGFNRLLRNQIKDFYETGIYVAGTYNTLIDSNVISRPTRTGTATTVYGIRFTTVSTSALVTRNFIVNPYGALLGNTSSTFYGIQFENVDALASLENQVINNQVSNITGNGSVYGLNNNSSDNVWYFHNTVSLDSTAATTTAGIITRGFNAASAADGIFFYNNLISISRGGASAKYCVYITAGANYIGDNNNLYISATSGTTNCIGFYGGNRVNILNWKGALAAVGSEQFTVSQYPVYALPDQSIMRPLSGAFDNKGLALGITNDIVGLPRDPSTPDIGAWEFVPPPCVAPPTAGTTVLNFTTVVDTTVCQNTLLPFGLNGNSFGFTQTFQWQYSSTIGGTYTDVGTPMPYPDTIMNMGPFPAGSISFANYWRCKVKCGTIEVYSNPILVTVTPALPAGNYTINSAGTNTYVPGVAGGNFISFNDAKGAMQCGIDGAGDVVFSVLPGANNGIYNEQLKLDTIPGTSMQAKVIFNGNGNTIQFSSTNSNERAVIKLNGADYVTFRNLVIDASGTGTFGYGVHILNRADTNTLKNCTINIPLSGSSTNYAGVVINGSANALPGTTASFSDNTVIDSCTINGGYYGIVSASTTAAPIVGSKFTNNKIKDFFHSGVFLSAGNSSTLIEADSISRPTRTNSFGSGYGIYLSGVSTGTFISKNRIFNLQGGITTGSYATYGIAIDNCDAGVGNETYVVNNLLYNFNGIGAMYGLSNTGSDYVNYYHNTVVIDNEASTATQLTRGFSQTTTAQGIRFINNIISITRGGAGVKHAVYWGAATSTAIESNNNDYYVTPGTTNHIGFNGTNRTTLTDWKVAVTPQDQSSYDYDPAFINPTVSNYIPAMAPLDNKGSNVNIVDDIVVVTRSATTPDLGAHEFTVPTCTSPPSTTTATVTPNTGLCVDIPITLDVPGLVSAAGLKFIWQNSVNGTTWTDMGDSLYLPLYKTLSKAGAYYRCLIVCNGTVVNSTVVTVVMNKLLLAGSYTINNAIPTNYTGTNPGANFQTFADAVQAMECGITGSVVFNVVNDPSAPTPGVYNEQVYINKVPGSGANATVTFQAANGNPASVKLTATGTTTANYTLKIDSVGYITFRNLTLENVSTTFGRVVELGFTTNNDSIVGNIINAPVVATTANTAAAIFANGVKGSSLVIKGNTVNNGSIGIYFAGTSNTNLAKGHFVDSNTVNGAYAYGVWTQFTNRLSLTKNTVNVSSPIAGTFYGINTNYNDTAYRVLYNNVNISNTAGTVWGINITNSRSTKVDSGIVASNKVIAGAGNTSTIYGLTNNTGTKNCYTVNNVIAITSAGTTAYGLYSNGCDSVSYYNNTVQVSSPNKANQNVSPVYFNHTAAASIRIRNNIFSNKGGGRAVFVANPTFFTADYNLLYSTGDTLVRITTPSAYYKTLADWRNTYFWDLNSVSGSNGAPVTVPPAFVSDTDLQPDVTNPDVWLMHGRGTQLSDNTYDFYGNPRETSTHYGVPDLGAYEFLPPTSTLPSVMAALPATPAPNTTQRFMYGTDTVMVIKWGATAPASINLRRYSGVVPQGLKPVYTDSMFFYVQAEVPGGTTVSYPGYKAELQYIKPWLGNVQSEFKLGLGRTDDKGPQSWYVDPKATINVNKRRIIDATENLQFLDKFTGLVNPYAVVPIDADSSNKGKNFWTGYARSWDFTNGNSQEMVLYFSNDSNEPANVQVEINGTSYVRNYIVPPNTVLPSNAASVGYIPKVAPFDARLTDEGQYTRGIHITSDISIAVYAHIFAATNSGATMLLPTGVWGYEYYSLNSRQNYTATAAYSSFFVVADNDNTVVEITPSNPTLAGKPANTTFSVTLNKGEIYQVLGAMIAGAEGYDLTGSKIKSVPNPNGKCYPIGVFAGSSRTGLGCGTAVGGSGDINFQQMFPFQAWGKHYFTAPATNTTGTITAASLMTNIFRIMVKDPTTVITYKKNGVVTALPAITNNIFYQFESNTADEIISDKPIMVAQYFSSSGSCPNTAGNGDPELFYLSPVEQGVNRSGYYRNNLSSIDNNYITVVIPTGGMTSLKVDNTAWAAIPAANKFSYPHPANPNYTVIMRRYDATTGLSIIESDSSFTGIVYGLGNVESYGYNIGTLVKSLKVLDSIQIGGGGDVGYTCASTPFNVKVSVPMIPDSIKFQFSQIPGVYYYSTTKPFNVPAKDTTLKIPPTAYTGTSVVQGVTYYTYALPANYGFNDPGTYTLPVTYYSLDIESCDNSYTTNVIIQVFPSPKTDFKITYPGGGTTGCEGDVVTLTGDAQTVNFLNLKDWKWTFVNQSPATGTGQTQTLTYPAPGTYTVSLRGVAINGCEGDTTKQIVINPKPVVNVVAQNLTACPGATATFQIQNPQTGVTYEWYNSTGTLVNTGNSYAATAPTTAGTAETYTVKGVSQGCSSVTPLSVTITALTQLPAPVINTPVVTASTATFTWNAITGATGYNVYVGSSTTPVVIPAGTTTYSTPVGPLQTICITVQAIGAQACQTSAQSTQVCSCVPATLVVAPSDTTICSGGAVTFRVQNPGSGVVYNWYASATSTTVLFSGPNYTVTNITAAGSYFVAGVSGSCTSARTEVKVQLLSPLAATTVTADSIGANLVRFRWTAVAGATGYQISTDNGATWSNANGTLQHTLNGLQPNTQVCILVKAIGTNPCQNSTSTSVCATTRIDDIFIPNAFTPNADGNNDVFEFCGWIINDIHFMIFNQWGEKVAEVRNPVRDARGCFKVWDGTFKGKKQPAGVYIYVGKFVLANGNIVERKGSINLIR